MAGRLVFDFISLPTASVANTHVAPGADLTTDKMRHLHVPGTPFSVAIGGTPATHEEIVHVAGATGTVLGFHCLLSDTGTSTSVTFDLKKNGVSILSAPVAITHADTDREIVDGILSNASLAAGDVLSISLSVSSATGATGPYAWIDIEEAPGMTGFTFDEASVRRLREISRGFTNTTRGGKPPQRRAPILTVGIALAKAVGHVPKDSLGTFQRYAGDILGSETAVEDATETAWNRWKDIEDGAWAILLSVQGEREVLQWECEADEAPSEAAIQQMIDDAIAEALGTETPVPQTDYEAHNWLFS